MRNQKHKNYSQIRSRYDSIRYRSWPWVVVSGLTSVILKTIRCKTRFKFVEFLGKVVSCYWRRERRVACWFVFERRCARTWGGSCRSCWRPSPSDQLRGLRLSLARRHQLRLETQQSQMEGCYRCAKKKKIMIIRQLVRKQAKNSLIILPCKTLEELCACMARVDRWVPDLSSAHKLYEGHNTYTSNT